MAYSVVDDIKLELPKIDFTTGKLLEADVTSIIEIAESEIDAVLRMDYVLPITDTDDLLLLKNISLGIVVDKVRLILSIKDSMNDKYQDMSRSKKANKLLKKIEDGILKLKSTRLKTSSLAINTEELSFKTGKDNW